MEDKVEFKDNILTIHYENYGQEERNYDSLFDFLGDNDIITASEIGQDVILMDDLVFFFTHNDESKLKENSSVELNVHSTLEAYIDLSNPKEKEFYSWYKGQ